MGIIRGDAIIPKSPNLEFYERQDFKRRELELPQIEIPEGPIDMQQLFAEERVYRDGTENIQTNETAATTTEFTFATATETSVLLRHISMSIAIVGGAVNATPVRFRFRIRRNGIIIWDRIVYAHNTLPFTFMDVIPMNGLILLKSDEYFCEVTRNFTNVTWRVHGSINGVILQ